MSCIRLVVLCELQCFKCSIFCRELSQKAIVTVLNLFVTPVCFEMFWSGETCAANISFVSCIMTAGSSSNRQLAVTICV
jgi:hypothetical protein